MSGLGRQCPDCGGPLTDGHDDGRDLVEVSCGECGEEFVSTPAGWLRPDDPKVSESWQRFGEKIRLAMDPRFDALRAAEAADAPTLPRLTLLPGGLLGRVTGHDADGLPMVDRWHHGLAFTGWRAFGVEGRPLPTESPERHPSYAAALARIGEVAT